MLQRHDRVAELRAFITDEFVKAIGFSKDGVMRRLVGPLIYLPAHKFASLADELDSNVHRYGAQGGAQRLLPRFSQDLQVNGLDRVPRDGPLVIASNHPGAFDSVALFSCIPRADLRAIASGAPFVKRLPSVSEYLIFTAAEPSVRMGAARATLRHLRQGGAALVFATGLVDPDPAVYPGAREALGSWSPSLALFLLKAPETHIQISIVSGVVSPSAPRNLIARIPKEPWQQRRLAEYFQMMRQVLFPNSLKLTPKITLGEPFTLADLGQVRTRDEIMRRIIERAEGVLELHERDFLR